jgi:hypothetical protein
MWLVFISAFGRGEGIAPSRVRPPALDQPDDPRMQPQGIHEGDLRMLARRDVLTRFFDFDKAAHELSAARFVQGVEKQVGDAENIWVHMPIDQPLKEVGATDGEDRLKRLKIRNRLPEMGCFDELLMFEAPRGDGFRVDGIGPLRAVGTEQERQRAPDVGTQSCTTEDVIQVLPLAPPNQHDLLRNRELIGIRSHLIFHAVSYLSPAVDDVADPQRRLCFGIDDCR